VKTFLLTILFLTSVEFTFAQKSWKAVDSFMVSKFRTSTNVHFVDSSFLKFKVAQYEGYCIAAKGNNFNRTDEKEEHLCDCRMILYGKSLSNNLHIFLFEEFQGGRVGVSCEMFFVDSFVIHNYLYFFCNRKIRTLPALKKWLKEVDLIPMKSF
jgi:hypothetical protein